jgi:hypothetical protein
LDNDVHIRDTLSREYHDIKINKRK